jgi:hypothetical protein
MPLVTRFPMIGEHRCLDPRPLAEDFDRIGLAKDFWGLANSITCPTGQEPGSAWFLVSREVGDALENNAYYELKWVHENSSGKRTTTTWQKYVLCRAVLVGLDGDGMAPYLLEFRDKRQVLKFGAIDREYNIRRTTRQGDTGSTDLYYEDSRNGGSDWTWQTMFSDVWSNLPSAIRGTAPTLAYTPASEPEGFRFHGSAWDAVGEILEATQSILCLDPIGDTFTVQRLGATQSGLAAAKSALRSAGKHLLTASPLTDLNLASAPATIRFFFPKRVENDSQLAESEDGGPLVDPYHTIDKTTGISGAQAGTVLPYRTEFIAELDADGSTINNASALDTLATELKDKLVDRITNATESGRDHYGGIVTTIKPGCEIGEVVWRDYGDSEGCVTEIWRRPELGEPGLRPVRRLEPINGVTIHRGITDEPLGKGTTMTVSRYNPGTTVDSTINDEVTNEMADVGTGKVVYYFEQGGNKYVFAAECPLT